MTRDSDPPPRTLKTRGTIASPARVAAFQTGLSAVARRRGLLAFVEVKARPSLDDAAYSVTPQQQQRIIAAAQAWLMTHPEHAEFDMRFDAILIAPKHLPKHLMAAFDASA